MNEIIEIDIIRLLLAYIFVVIALIIVKLKGISKEKEIIVSTLRMTIQLTFVGYILIYLFENINPLYTLLVVGIMEFFAIHTIFKRVKKGLNKPLKKVIAFSMCVGTLSSLMYFLIVVLNLTPWYDTRYFIPIAGMLIGNSMTGISLGVTKLIDGMTEQKHIVENSLMLGASPKQSAKPIIDKAFDSAILPTINSMMGMGIIFLPGMMTGQILSGTNPILSIQYQIAIMLGILGSVTFTVILFVQLGYKTFFNDDEQLII